MKIKIEKSELLNLLKINEMVGNCKAIPITDNYRVQILNGNLEIISTDLENDIKTVHQLNSNLFDEELFLVNRKKLYTAVNNIRNGILDVSTTDNSITIQSGSSKMVLPIETNKDEIISFPDVNFETNTPHYDASKLLEPLRNASKFVGNDDMRPVMKGISFEVDDNTVTICGTDAHKLYVEQIDNPSIEQLSIIIPVTKIIKNGFEEISFIKDNDNITHAIYTTDKFLFRSRLIDGKFPNFKAVIPKNNDKVMNLDKAALLNSLNELKTSFVQCLVMMVKGTKIIFNAEDLENSMTTLSYINANESNIEDVFSIGCNLEFLKNVLEVMDSNIMLSMSETSRPIIITDSNERKTTLIMPVMINNLFVDFNETYASILGETKNKIKEMAVQSEEYTVYVSPFSDDDINLEPEVEKEKVEDDDDDLPM